MYGALHTANLLGPCYRLHNPQNPIHTSSSPSGIGILTGAGTSTWRAPGYENHGSLALLAVGYREQRWPILVATSPVH